MVITRDTNQAKDSIFHVSLQNQGGRGVENDLSVSSEIVGLFSSDDVSVSVRAQSSLHLYRHFTGISIQTAVYHVRSHGTLEGGKM